MAIISVLFLLGHMAVGHKELRFLFPIAIAVLYMSCMGLDYVLSVYPKINKINLPLKVAFVVNTALILFRTFTPANETIPYFRYIYQASNTPNTVLVCMQKSIYNDGHIESNFYKPKHLQVIVVQNLEEFDQLVAQNPEKKILYFSDHQHPEQQMQHHVFHRLYSLFPDWILANNINDWQSRSDIWGIYEVAIKH
jgi:phosphatidylinositol glycan class B